MGRTLAMNYCRRWKGIFYRYRHFSVLRMDVRILIILYFSFLFTFSIAECSDYSITNWTNGNALVDFVEADDGFWAVTTGGLVRWTLPELSYVKYTTADGLGDNWFKNGTADSSGNFWFGSVFGGLMKYDGTEWEVITEEDGIPYNEITALAVDSSDRLWAGFGAAFGNGLGILENGEWFYITRNEGLTHNYITCIAMDSAGAWVGTRGGINRIENDIVVSGFTEDNGLPPARVSSIAADDAGNVWIGTECGLSFFNGWYFTNYYMEDGLPSDRINDLLIRDDGALLIGTSNGLAIWNQDERCILGPAEGISGRNVKALYALDSDLILCGVYNRGIDLLEDSSITGHIRTNDWLPGNEIRGLAFEGDKLWYATFEGGVGWYDRRAHTHAAYFSEPGLEGTQVRCLAIDHGGLKWFGTFGDGVYSFNDSAWRHYTVENSGLPDDKVLGIFIDDDGSRWFATFGGGICRYDGSDWDIIDESDGLPINLTYNVTKDLEGCYWFCTDLGVTRYDGENLVSYYEEDGLIFHRVYEASVDAGDIKWFGACKGLSLFDGETFTNYTVDDGLVHYRVRDIIFDEDDKAWLATGGGANVFDGVNFESITTEDGLAGFETYAVVHGTDGARWFGSRGGISVVRPAGDPCPATGVTLSMPSLIYRPGDTCSCSVALCNAEGTYLEGYPLFVLLEIYGDYYFGPDFTSEFDTYLDLYAGFTEGETPVTVIDPFAWPYDAGAGSASWFAGLADPSMSVVLGDIDVFSFVWLE